MEVCTMASREELQTELESLLGTRQVYFNPPENVRMTYPAIVYSRPGYIESRANDKAYTWRPRYEVTIIDTDPLADYVDRMLKRFTMVTHNSTYVGDGLYHYSFTLYY